MSIRAYMLVETDRDAVEFVREARKVPGVVAAHALFGPLDAIVAVEAPDMRGLEEVVGRIHRVPGLKSGDTRIARSA
ncbi:MAG: Lrp/AsnC ligand binding domain-containing protein [Chloroflexi bacterium]|nr:Lrp/AsnC ligand binding domain-containing protein [Chloroflexota bacterium]